MAHFAFLCLPFYSHLRLFEALAVETKARGHTASLIVNEKAAQFVERTDLATYEVPAMKARRSHPDRVIANAARPSGLLGILRTVSDTAAMTQAFCAGAPDLFRELGVDVIVGDQMEPAVGLLADHLSLPFASIAAALPLNRAPGIPLPFLDWPFDPSEPGLKRNEGGEKVARLLLRRQNREIARWAERFELEPRRDVQACLSPLLQIAQTVPGFDFPRPFEGPLRMVGPIRARLATRSAGGTGIGATPSPEPPLAFVPSARRPVVFASLGTLQGHRLGLFRMIGRACRQLGASLVVAHCGGLSAEQAATIDADFVTDFVPQRSMLARSAVCITHGGLNTVLDAIEMGVPMLALPIAFDQRGVAARILHHGIGEAVRYDRADTDGIRRRLERLLADDGYRRRAAPIRAEIAEAGGLSGAVDLLEEQLLGQDRPVATGIA